MTKYQEYNSLNKLNMSSTPRRFKQKDNFVDSNSLNHNSIELNNKLNTNINNQIISKKPSSNLYIKEQVKKTPKEILSALLKNSLGKSLLRLEERSKEQLNNLKFTGKYFIIFEKNILSMINGVEKKRKEDEKKKRLAKKMKINSTPNRIRSKTVQNIRKITREDSIINTNKNRNKINLKQNSTFLKKNNQIEESPKIRSRTVKSSRYTSSYGLKSKNSKDINIYKAKIENTPKINKLDKYKAVNRLTGEFSNSIENNKNEESNRKSLKDRYNTTNPILSNMNRGKIRTRSRKNTINKEKDKEKLSRKNSINKRNKNKNRLDNKQNIKIEEDKKINNNINNINFCDQKKDSPKIKQKETEKIKISDFSEEIKGDKEFDANENININQIINNKINEEKKVDIVLKELEEYNEKKPRLEEGNELNIIRERSRSKNKDNKNIEEFEGSLNEVKLKIEGVNSVLDKLKSDKKIKFEKKVKNKEEFDEENKNIEDKKIEQIDKEVNELLQINENGMKNIDREDEQNSIENKPKDNVFENHTSGNEINEEKKENGGSYINNFPINKNIRFGKESQILNEEIINTIQNDKIILSNSILDNNIFMEVNGQKKENNDIFDDNKKNKLNNPINNIINYKIENNNIQKIQINGENFNNIVNDKKDMQENNLIVKLEEEKKLNNEKKEIIPIESGIHDEQYVDNNQSLNQSSFINQSSIINQSAILAEQYVLIERIPNAPFSIENTLKFDKNQYLAILNYLNFEEKINFTGINRGFIIERIYLLNNKREEMIRSLELTQGETVDDLIMKTRLNYSKDELEKNFTEFQIPRGGAKAVELLNNELYSKLFKKSILEKNSEEIYTVYRVLFAIFGEYEIANIFEDQLFWIKCTEYLNKNSNGKIGSFILEKFKNISFEHKKIYLLNKLLIRMKKKINPNYFSKICGTTGLLIFLIKDTLEYCGVIINEKKTQPARIIDNLMYYKNSIEKLAFYIDYLSGIKTYKIKEKKEKEKENK